MSDFNPLDAQRAIRDDDELQKSEKAMLWAAVLRTDNATRKVKASLAMLAKDAGYRPNAATTVFAETNEPVMRYFEKVERHLRRTDLWFHPSDRLTMRVSHAESESEVSTHAESESGDDDRLTMRVSSEDPFEVAKRLDSRSEGVGLTLRVSRTHDESDPSASLCSSSASSTTPTSTTGDEEALDSATPSGPLPEEPSSVDDEAAEEESRGMGRRRHLGSQESDAGEPTPEPARYRGRSRAH